MLWYNEQKGYGIAVMDDGKSVFLHRLHLTDAYPCHPRQGDVVEFDLYEQKDGRYVAYRIELKRSVSC